MLRKTIFWCHLVAGLISAVAIGVMCFTGAALAFEKDLIAWSERDARLIEPPAANTTRLPLEELQRNVRAAHPEARPTSIVLHRDPAVAVAFSSGRAGTLYANPYTGEIRAPQSASIGRFMQEMLEWHRYLNFTGEASRPRGKLVNGVCNVAFCLLAVTGLYLWLPRSWSRRALRPAIWFTQNSSAKARDFNWHNVIGFWCAPILIVLTLTAMPISFRWAGSFLFTVTGTPQPASNAPGARDAATDVDVPPPAPNSRPLPFDTLIASARQNAPAWETITLRLGGPRGRRDAAASDAARAPGAVNLVVRESGSWPRTATTTLTLNPFTGEILGRTGYADQNAAQRLRSWTRFLHTGEAVGWFGQVLAGLACIGGCFLVYTGAALSWRRFFGKKPPVA